jgi:hypothetical protein
MALLVKWRFFANGTHSVRVADDPGVKAPPAKMCGDWAKFALASGGDSKVTGFTTVIASSGRIGQSTGSKSHYGRLWQVVRRTSGQTYDN